jgi:hypothetical protein
MITAIAARLPSMNRATADQTRGGVLRTVMWIRP